MDPATAALIAAGITGVGNFFSGKSQAEQSKESIAEQRRQFDLTMRRLREQDVVNQAMDQQRINQQAQQYRNTWQQNEDQFGSGFNQRENQFGANFAQNENQFGATYGQRERQFGADFDRNERQFESNFDRDERQFGAKFGQDERMYADKSAFDRAKYQDERLKAAIGVQRSLNMAPLNDRALYMLQQRAGATPAAFQARDFTRGTVPGAGQATGGMGSVLAAQQKAAQGYRPGMGGFDTSAMKDAFKRYMDPDTLPAAYQAQSYTAGTYKPQTYTQGPAYKPQTYTPQTYTPRAYSEPASPGAAAPSTPAPAPTPSSPPKTPQEVAQEIMNTPGGSGAVGGGASSGTPQRRREEEEEAITRFIPYVNDVRGWGY